MSNFIYSTTANVKNSALFGKFDKPIKALIESESDYCEKQKTSLDYLWNIEKSNRFAETVMGQSDFDTFMAVPEGGSPENDSTEVTFNKSIEHVQFIKEFTITKTMADDCKFGMGAELKRLPRNFVRAYYKTRTRFGAAALANGTKSEIVFNKAKIDLTTGDKKPLFFNEHPFAKDEFKGKKQTNYYNGTFTDTTENIEKTLSLMSNNMRNFKDENGDAMGYVADTIIIPCNRPEFERKVKTVVGSERTTGSGNNDINTQYGNWNIVVLENWETAKDEMMLMSTDANENLLGNMFYNRVPLNIVSDVDNHTRNNFWNGYCRFGLGFTTWKHILRVVNDGGSVEHATKFTLA